VITLLAGFLIFIVAFVSAGAKYQWTQARGVIDQTIQESRAPNYHYIARTEREIWGAAFHNSGTKMCQCNTICHPETFYIPEVQPPRTMGEATAQYYGSYGYGQEWEDREGE
jgi:hypothetical protein